ncbi:AraC family transcriptional regulator [Bacillus salipaludis]|uniref:AraC family transcriptional regulator n=1 Tax=Bacillus salipaludis TaxID=2547811 RepID=A0A4R5VIK3_9BACI|nr:AraC family transcriptional regulator [Bacillus salipaludis]MDQ6598941.1 AraC family transcriptional regulator [Bacillus salipaludis]TDK56214.1 AraC family transcriptional regulator [Bacillus salipaludis]
MEWIESLQKAIDFMEEHLLEEISIGDIAKEAKASVFHFQRTFTILTDISVGEYLRRRRLTLAAQELSNTNNKIIDIAFKYGYETPEAFSKAFRRQHGITPREARSNKGILNSYNRLVIQVSLKGAEPMKYKIVERESFQVVGVKKEFSTLNDDNIKGIPKMWGEVHKDGTNELLFKINNGKIEGILGVCVTKKEYQGDQLIDYWIATEYVGETPDGLEILDIPSSKWAVFEVHGPMPDAMPRVWKQIYQEWFPSNAYEHAGTPELEVYSDEDPSSEDLYSEIWIPLKQR